MKDIRCLYNFYINSFLIIYILTIFNSCTQKLSPEPLAPIIHFLSLEEKSLILKKEARIHLSIEIESQSEYTTQWKVNGEPVATDSDSYQFNARHKGLYIVEVTASNKMGKSAETVIIGVDLDPHLIPQTVIYDTLTTTIDTFEFYPFIDNATSYVWELNGKIVSDKQKYVFATQIGGSHSLTLTAENDKGFFKYEYRIYAKQYPFVTHILDYIYGVGQHAQSLAADQDGSNLLGNTSQYVFLGGWGGYIVADFDHSIMNREGYDFSVIAQVGIGSEAGVVYVMKDQNRDGRANDTWYELRGSEFDNPETIRNYELTYYKPPNLGINIMWDDNQGRSGELVPGYGSSSATWWWAGYGTNNDVTFTGTVLPNSYEQSGGQWINKSDVFSWGYAENYIGEDYKGSTQENQFDLSYAIDSNGNAVTLTGIDFVKVQSGIFQIAGWLNEISTEIKGIKDLNIE